MRGFASRKLIATMNRLLALSSYLLILSWAFEITGCSSKNPEVAIAPSPAAPAATEPYVDTTMDSGGEDTSADSGSGSASDSSDEGVGIDLGDPAPEAGDETTGMVDQPDMTTGDASGDASAEGSQASLPPTKPKNLREQAEQAFGDGQEKAAYRLLQAHVLSSSTDVPELLANYRWSTARRQPQLGARIAIGVVLTAPSETQEYKPIGSLRGFFKSATGRRKNGDPGENDQGVTLMETQSPERVLQKYTGLMGDVLVSHFQKSHAEGKWSPAFRSVPGVASNRMNAMNGDASGGETGFSGDGGMLAAGRWPLETKIEGDEAKYVSLGPTLAFLGTESMSVLVTQAKAGEFDALVVFDVVVTINQRARMIYNECRAKLVNLADGKAIAASKLLKNTEVQKEIDESGIKVVEAAMRPMLNKLDEQTAMVEVPNFLTAEIIKTKRLPTLVTDQSRSKLELLAEIKLYRNSSLLEDEDVKEAFEKILGAEDGRLLATGSDQERLAVVKKLLSGS